MPYNIRQQAAFVTTGDPATVNDVSPYAPGMLGVKMTIKEPGPLGTPGSLNPPQSGYPAGQVPVGDQYKFGDWQYVQTDSAMTTTPFPSAVAYWSNKQTYLVTTDPSILGRTAVAGVFAGFPVKGNFTWIKTGGPARVKFIDAVNQGNATTGAWAVGSATAGKADVVAAGTAPGYQPLGTFAGVLNIVDLTAIVNLDVPVTP